MAIQTLPRTRPPVPDGREALDALAGAAAAVDDGPAAQRLLAVVVERLEQLAGVSLGDCSGDPVVVLQRRLARASRHLLAPREGAEAGAEQHAGELVALLPLLRDAGPAPRPQQGGPRQRRRKG